MITTDKIVAMIHHWLATPANGYFAQSYGNDIKKHLLVNLSAFTADEFIRKMKQDIPVLQQLNSDQLSIVSQTVDFESVKVFIKLGHILIDVGLSKNSNLGDTAYYDPTAN
ncbi:hypothetical protein [Faucicola boevrei]|uniref:hypothetical protein n=1 Tax=Faucicola boevrei TaxID=346665 RepID=UPI00037DE94C|nr:hypothetical protein [Moraxella boevrei]